MKQKYRTVIVNPLGTIYSKSVNIDSDIDSIEGSWCRVIQKLNNDEINHFSIRDSDDNPIIIPNALLKQSYIKIEKL